MQHYGRFLHQSALLIQEKVKIKHIGLPEFLHAFTLCFLDMEITLQSTSRFNQQNKTEGVGE